MTESTTAPTQGPDLPSRSNDGGTSADGGATGLAGFGSTMLFPQLVLAHFRYFALHARYGETGGIPREYAPNGTKAAASESDKTNARREYEQALERFQQSAGRITDAYWCVVAPSAVALTEGSTHRVLRFLWMSEPEMRLHRESEWLTNGYPDISIYLHHCDTLALKAAAVLRGTAKRIALESLFAEEKFLLAAAEERKKQEQRSTAESRVSRVRPAVRADSGKPGSKAPASDTTSTRVTPTSDSIGHAKRVLLEIEKYYDRAGNRAARIVYFWGMVTGVVVALVLAAFFALVVHVSFLALDVDEENVRNFFICYAAGALGAVVSVLMRMRSEDGFTLDYEVGRSQSFRLGSFRPFLGAVFGLLIFFALESGLLQIAVPDGDPTTDATEVSPYFLAFIAFVAGFSERLAHVVLGKAERTVAATVERSDDGETARPVDGPSGTKGLESHLELITAARDNGLVSEEQAGEMTKEAVRIAAEPG
jgi:hypothetical protein